MKARHSHARCCFGFFAAIVVLLGAQPSSAAVSVVENASVQAPPSTGMEPDELVVLWPDGPPGPVPAGLGQYVVHRSNPSGLPDRAIHDVTNPALAVFHPTRPNGGAIVIAPGGGYAWVVLDKEGYEAAVRFSRLGYTVYVLRYRLPHQGWQAQRDAPLQDIQRAIRVVRSRVAQDGTRPASVLLLGFSAGGHLAGSLAARFDSVLHQPADPIDRLDARPDLVALMYPVVTMSPPHAHRRSRDNLLGPAPSPEQIAGASLEVNVRAGQPPALLIHAADDPAVPVDHSLMLAASLRAASVPVALHVFESGGHGFGLRGIAGTPLERWPDLLLDWAVSHGFPRPIED